MYFLLLSWKSPGLGSHCLLGLFCCDTMAEMLLQNTENTEACHENSSLKTPREKGTNPCKINVHFSNFVQWMAKP